MRFRWVLLVVASLVTLTSTMQSMQDSKNVWAGVYTDAQAAQGRRLYEEFCSRCHASDLSGNVGGSLKGEVFIRDWGGKTAGALYDRMKTTMPRGAAGSLADDVYLKIVAYVFQVNGFPADPAAELKPELLQTILIESKEGPGYIPSSALVESVGCLTQGDDKVWMLTNATDFARVAEAGAPNANTLTAAAQKDLGKSELRLLYIFPSPDALKGHRVYSKGLLIRDPKGNSINVTSLQDLATECK